MKFENLSISVLQLDKTNPRIARVVEMYQGDPPAEQIALALGVGESSVTEGAVTFHSLRESIKTHRGLIHPILVNKVSKGNYVVIEGNTRLAIFKEFHEARIEGKWDSIPCIIHENLSSAEINAIRLQAHLVGPREWDPYSKAKYLAHLRDNNLLTWNQIIDYCGGKRKEAQYYYDAYHDMEKYYRPILEDDTAFDPTRFSAFVELQKPRIKDSVINAGFTLEDFAKWVNNRNFTRLENVRRLPDLLGNKESKNLFLKDCDKEALKILDAPPADINLDKISLLQLARLLTERIRSIRFEDITKFQKDSSLPEPLALLDAKEALDDLFETISSNEA